MRNWWTMIWLFLNKFIIFLIYYVGITAFIFILHINNVIYLFEENILFKSFNHHAKPVINNNYEIIIGKWKLSYPLYFLCVYCKILWFIVKFVLLFIRVVGAGTAGLSIADGIDSTDVLIVEAGTDFQSHSTIVSSTISRILHNIPMITPLLQLQNSFDWQYKTEPQEYACKGLVDNISYWPTGKGFGGTQLINNMIYHRGFELDYQHWFNETPYNWRYSFLFPYESIFPLLSLSLTLILPIHVVCCSLFPVYSDFVITPGQQKKSFSRSINLIFHIYKLCLCGRALLIVVLSIKAWSHCFWHTKYTSDSVL